VPRLSFASEELPAVSWARLSSSSGLTEHLNVSRVFVRDLEQCWYQRGLKGLGTNVLDAAGGLLKVGQQLFTNENRLRWHASGGFAAAMFGSLLGADEVIAISPQTTIRRIHRLRLGDRRWKLQIRKARASCVDPVHLDLVAMRNEGPYYPPLLSITEEPTDLTLLMRLG